MDLKRIYDGSRFIYNVETSRWFFCILKSFIRDFFMIFHLLVMFPKYSRQKMARFTI